MYILFHSLGLINCLSIVEVTLTNQGSRVYKSNKRENKTTTQKYTSNTLSRIQMSMSAEYGSRGVNRSDVSSVRPVQYTLTVYTDQYQTVPVIRTSPHFTILPFMNLNLKPKQIPAVLAHDYSRAGGTVSLSDWKPWASISHSQIVEDRPDEFTASIRMQDLCKQIRQVCLRVFLNNLQHASRRSLTNCVIVDRVVFLRQYRFWNA